MKEVYSLGVDNKALQYYKENTKRNKNESEITLINKLRRNFVLGKFVRENKDYQTLTRSYGNLYITVKDNIIIRVENSIGYHKFDIDMNKKKALDTLLNLKVEGNIYGK